MSAFEKINTDRQLQDHWLRRLVAGIIDGVMMLVIAGIITGIISFLPALPIFAFSGIFIMGTFPFLSGILFFLYAAFMEASRGTTVGKQIMNFKVTTTQGASLTLDKAFIRNISKIHGVLLLIDVLIGMATVGDPHQKYSDRWVGTTVTSTIDRGLLLPTPPSPPNPPSNA